MVAPAVLAAGLSAGSSLLGGFLGSRAARRTGRNLNAIAEAQEQQRRMRSGDLASGIGEISNRYRGAYNFRPVTSRNAFGSAGMNANGDVYTEGSPLVTQAAGQYGTLADQEYAQLMGLDRNAMAAQRLGQLTELQRPGDEAASERMMDTLRRKGLLGFATKDYRTGGVSNPYALALESARATRGLQQTYDTTDWVENNITNRMNNLTGMRNNQFSTLRLPDSNLDPMRWAYSTRRNADIEAAKYGFANDMLGLNAGLDARYTSDAYWDNSRQAAGASLQGRQGMIRGIQGGMMSMLPYLTPSQERQPPAPIVQRTFPGYNPYPANAGMFGAEGWDYGQGDVQVTPIRNPYDPRY